MTETSTSGRQLLTFLDRQASEKGSNAGTASSRRSAVREVLNVAFGPGWEDKSFTRAAVPSLLDAFAQTRVGDFTKESIRSYQSNFRRTVELSFQESEPTKSDVEWLTHRFPIRAGAVAEFSLPVDLSRTEAQRLCTLIANLPLEDA